MMGVALVVLRCLGGKRDLCGLLLFLFGGVGGVGWKKLEILVSNP